LNPTEENKMFEGVLTALITPFKDGQIDVEALQRTVERQIKKGVDGLVACGTTGEAAAMSMDERLLVVRHVVQQAAGRVPVIAGTGTNNSRVTMEMTRKAASLKVDGVLVVTPYYIKPTQRGLLEHFNKVAEIGVPVVAYNVPGRTGVSLTVESVSALARIDKVVAIKEATGDLSLGAQMVVAAEDKLTMLSGDDFTYLPFLSIGGKGCISVLSNVVPDRVAQMTALFNKGETAEALKIHQQLLPLTKALFIESNPIPVKYAMAKLGLCSTEIRAPLGELNTALAPKLDKIMTALNLQEG
jgi:4-hydroxy-tetrahydrodipicolinate synthase